MERSCDLNGIMSHYADDIEFFSPFALEMLSVRLGRIEGKQALRSYSREGLRRFPDLHFPLIRAVPGVASIVILYCSVRGLLVAEVAELNARGKVKRVLAHYAQQPM